MKKVSVDQEKCIGCGACQAIASNVFEINDEGLAEVITDNIKEEDKEDVMDAYEGCPVGAIVVEE